MHFQTPTKSYSVIAERFRNGSPHIRLLYNYPLLQGKSGNNILNVVCMHYLIIQFSPIPNLHCMSVPSKSPPLTLHIWQPYFNVGYMNVRSIQCSHFVIRHWIRFHSKKAPCRREILKTLFEILIGWLAVVWDSIPLKIFILWGHILCTWLTTQHASNPRQTIMCPSSFYAHVTDGHSHAFDIYMVVLMHWSHREKDCELHVRLVINPQVNQKATWSVTVGQQFNVSSRHTCHSNSKQQNAFS